MAEIWANFSGESYPEKEMELARSHPTETFLYHHQASFDLESSREAKERSSTEHLETLARSRDQRSMAKSWYQQEKDAQDRRLWRETVDGLCS